MSRARTPKDPRLPLTTRVIDEEPTAAVVPDELESRVYRECSPASAGASQDIRPDIVPFSVTLWLLLFWRCSPERCYAGHFEVSDAIVGSANWKTAPRGSFGIARNRPPWAATIERLMDSPIPIPSGLVVKNGSKIRSLVSAFSPRPESRTSTRTSLVPSIQEEIDSSRGAVPGSLIASTALRMRFITSC